MTLPSLALKGATFVDPHDQAPVLRRSLALPPARCGPEPARPGHPHLIPHRRPPDRLRRHARQAQLQPPTVTSSGTSPYFRGGSIYIDFDPSSRWGIELSLHQVYTSNHDQTYERTYEFGERYLRHYGRLAPYARGMYGRGVYNYYHSLANLAYNLVAGGADPRVTDRINLRADYEFRKWLNFDPPGGMNPQLVTLGVAYHFPGGLKSGHRR